MNYGVFGVIFWILSCNWTNVNGSDECDEIMEIHCHTLSLLIDNNWFYNKYINGEYHWNKGQCLNNSPYFMLDNSDNKYYIYLGKMNNKNLYMLSKTLNEEDEYLGYCKSDSLWECDQIENWHFNSFFYTLKEYWLPSSQMILKDCPSKFPIFLLKENLRRRLTRNGRGKYEDKNDKHNRYCHENKDNHKDKDNYNKNDEDDDIKATCRVLPDNNSGVYGSVTLRQKKGSSTEIFAKIYGLSPGNHGFHIHEYGDLTDGCVSTQGHYNPFSKDHGGPDDQERHVGDLGNIIADENGEAVLDVRDNLVKLYGRYSVIGRGIVIHEDEDDLGRGGYEDSLTTGHAGSRLACCVIGYEYEEEEEKED